MTDPTNAAHRSFTPDSEEVVMDDPTAELPDDLARVLRDPSIVIQRDHEIRLADGRTLAQHMEEWRNAPSNTASAHIEPTPEPVIRQGDASYVLDWLRQTEAPSNIVRLQEGVVDQLGGYLGAVARQVRRCRDAATRFLLDRDD